MAELPIQAEYTGSVCELKSMDNTLIATGKISEITSKYIKISNKNKELQVVDFGTLIKINVFNTKLGFKVIIGNVYTSTKSEISVVSIESLVNKERRHFFRVDMNLEAKAIFKRTANDTYPTEEDIIVKDMSLSGIRFTSKYPFKPGTVLAIEVCLKRKLISSFRCQIIRRISEESEEIGEYGCAFIRDEQSSDDDLLCSFLFQKQREFLNTNNNL